MTKYSKHNKSRVQGKDKGKSKALNSRNGLSSRSMDDENTNDSKIPKWQQLEGSQMIPDMTGGNIRIEPETKYMRHLLSKQKKVHSQ